MNPSTANGSTLDALRAKGRQAQGGLRVRIGAGATREGWISIADPRRDRWADSAIADLEQDPMEISFPDGSLAELHLDLALERLPKVAALCLLVRAFRWIAPSGQILIVCTDALRACRFLSDTSAPTRSRLAAARILSGRQTTPTEYVLDPWFAERLRSSLAALGWDVQAIREEGSDLEPRVVARAFRPAGPATDPRPALRELLRENLVAAAEEPTLEEWMRQANDILAGGRSWTSALPLVHAPLSDRRALGGEPSLGSARSRFPQGPLRLHLGCGETRLDDYLNIDYPRSHHNVMAPRPDLEADILGLSFPDGTVDEVRSHHVFEHFPTVVALALLCTWRRWTRDGGDLVVEVPDAEVACRTVCDGAAPWSRRMSTLRCLAGDQAAAWAYHVEQWFVARFERVLPALGWRVVEAHKSNWGMEPFLPNLLVRAQRTPGPRTTEQDRSACLEILRESLPSPADESLLHQWEAQLRTLLPDPIGAPSGQVASAPATMPASGPLLENLSFSQCGEDRIVRFIFKARGVERPSFIDIGAHHPTYLSNTALFYLNGCRGINVEPDPTLFESFPRERPGDVNLNIGIAERSEERDFFILNAKTLNTFSREGMEEIVANHPHFHVERVAKVRTEPLQAILDRHCAGRFPDFLSLDVEGLDIQILSSIRADNAPKVVCVETIGYAEDGTGRKATEILELMARLGYMVFGDTNINTIFVRRDFWILDPARRQEEFWFRLQPSTQEPQGVVSASNTTAIVFSKDRAFQLDGLLRSFRDQVADWSEIDIKILYAASTPEHERSYEELAEGFSDWDRAELHREVDFHSDLLKMINGYRHVLFLVDDTIFTNRTEIGPAGRLLDSRPDILGFSLRLGRNSSRCYTLGRDQRIPEMQEAANLVWWRWPEADADFGYPLEVSSSLYRVDDIRPLLEASSFTKPNSLEDALSRLAPKFSQTRPILAAHPIAKAFSIPANVVQKSHANRHGTTDANELLQAWQRGNRMDVRSLRGVVPDGAHMEVDLLRENPAPATNPLVTIVIPCYKQAEFLTECVESVASQTYSNLEILVVDDGSPDDTAEVAVGLIGKHPERSIRLLRKSNGGLSSARNHGIGQSRGKYILPLDNDDKLHPEMVASLVDLLESRPEISIASTDCQNFGGDSRRIQISPLGPGILQANCLPYCSMYRREVWEANGGYRENMRWGYEDWNFWVSSWAKGLGWAKVAEPLFFYRVKHQSMLVEAKSHDAELRARIVANNRDAYPEQAQAEACELLSSLAGRSLTENDNTMALERMQLALLAVPSGRDVERRVLQAAAEKLRGRLTCDPVRPKAGTEIDRDFQEADQLLSEGKSDEALALLAKAQESHPDRADLARAVAWLHLQRNELSQAQVGYTRATMLAPEEPTAHANLAVVMLRKGLPERAESSLRKVLDLRPEDPDALLALARILATTSRESQARALYARLAKSSPRHSLSDGDRSFLSTSPAGVASNLPAAGSCQGRIVAIVSAFNEGDVIRSVVGDLVENGIDVYLIDNSSTDDTVEQAGFWLGKGLLHIERFPQDAGYPERSSREYVWTDILRRKEEIALHLGADWYLHADADEFRESPWEGLSLSQAIRKADASGWSAIHYSLYNFRPIDDSFVRGSDPRECLTAYEPGEWFDTIQIKTWKNPGQRVDLVSTGGHSVAFPGRKVCPVPFVLRHYPIRGETHGRRKVMAERLGRFAPEEKAKGWHVQYDEFRDAGKKFLFDPARLREWDDGTQARKEIFQRMDADRTVLARVGATDPTTAIPWGSFASAIDSWTGSSLASRVEALQESDSVMNALVGDLPRSAKQMEQVASSELRRLLRGIAAVRLAQARASGDFHRANDFGKAMNHLMVGMTAADLAHESMASRSRGDIEDESRLLERLGTLANSAEVERVLDARESLARLPSVRRAPLPTSPDVTVVIPVHNGIELTRNCLDSLFSTPSRHTARIVVVDDASQDGTSGFLDRLRDEDKIRLVRHPENLGFAASCNDGAAAAQTDLLVFLNNDTIVQPGWLDALVDQLVRDDSVGIAGSRLLYPDGRIQHAGMVWEWQDGHPHPEHVFRRHQGDSPETKICLDYPCVTGACLAIPAGLFQELGGFSRDFGMYCEDVDLCLRTWEKGLRVRYVPASRLFHLESATPIDLHERAEKSRKAADLLRESWADRWPAAFESMPDWMWPRQAKSSATAPPTSSRPLRIGFDGRSFSLADAVCRGIGHYAFHHLLALLEAHPGCDLTVVHDDSVPAPADMVERTTALGAKWQKWSSRSAVDFDLFHAPDPMDVSVGHPSSFARYQTIATTATFHDIIPIKAYNGRIADWPAYLARLEEIQSGKTVLLCNSEFTRTDLLSAVSIEPTRVRTVGAGFNAAPSERTPTREVGDQLLRRLGVVEPFFLHVGAADPHKNFETTLAACQNLAKSAPVQLVVVGKIANALASARDEIVRAGLNHVVFTDYLKREELEILYSRAVAMLFPSRYEGFGFPLLEAMACGCPVVASNTTSIPEVVADAALTHSPDDLAGFVGSMRRLLEEPSLRKDLIAKGKARAMRFRWKDVADRTWAAWEELAAARGFAPGASSREIRPASRQLRIGFDARVFSVADSVVRGIGHYAIHHVKALLRHRPDCRITLLHDDTEPIQAGIRSELEALGAAWRPWSSCSSRDFDIFHTADPMFVFPGFASPFQRFSSSRISATFYDMTPLRMYEGRVANWPAYLARLDELRDSGATLLCISEFTRRDVMLATGIPEHRTRTVMAGFNSSGSSRTWTREEGDAVLGRMGIHKPFFVYVGTCDPHKNFEGALAAFQMVSHRNPAQLVVVGKLSHSIRSVRDQLAQAGVANVVFTDFIAREQLELLYSRAVATLFLSRYEGFGFPALEAMACGCPVVCSNATSLPEVVGDAALFCAPDDHPAIARTLARLMDEPVLRSALIEKGKTRSTLFSWDDVARKTWQAWEELACSPEPTIREPRAPAQVQWASPLWDPSGYGDESRAFLHHLDSTDLGVGVFAWGRHSETFRQAATEADRRRFDSLLGRELVPRRPVVLAMPAGALGRIPGAGHHVGRTTFETDGLPPDWVERCNAMDEIWVPCAFNRETFAKAGVTRPILVVPEGVDTSRFRPGLDALPIEGIPRKTTFLAVFEWTHRKGPDLLLKAWADAFGPHDDVRLVLRTYPPNQVEGNPDAWVELKIDEELSRHGRKRSDCAPIVVIAKQVPDSDMPRLYAAADVFVAPSRGEGWGRPHMEAMSCGVPVIATRWSGNLEFQNDDNSWLIEVPFLEAIDAREEFAFYRGQKWAAPSVESLRDLMRRAAGDPDGRSTKGARARRDMVQRWDWKTITPLAEARLREILHGVAPSASDRPVGQASLSPKPLGTAPGGAVRWCGQLFNFSGYARLAREAVSGLQEAGADVTADPLLPDQAWFSGLSAEERARWRALLERDPANGVLVCCDIPRDAAGRNELFQQMESANPGCHARVGWTMFETDRLPRGWAESLNRLDEVWVPSEFNRRTFAQAGVDAAKLQVVPGGIDPARYENASPMAIPGPRRATTFLSVFQWTRRKGWDVLLRAWAQAFKPQADVRLVLRCHPFGKDGKSMREVFDASLRTLGLTFSDMAPIVLLEDFLPESAIPSLYAASDVFVLPSRGEGWGLPYLEALAAGKPCIATAWGASVDFLDDECAWLASPRELVEVGPDDLRENSYLAPGHRWADPDPSEIATFLRQAASDVPLRLRKSQNARRTASRWSHHRTARAILQRITALGAGTVPAGVELGKALQATAASILQRRQGPPPAAPSSPGTLSMHPTDAIRLTAEGIRARHGTHPSPGIDGTVASGAPGASSLSIRWEGSQFVHHSLANVNREICLRLAKAGHDLSLIPFEPDQFGPEGDADLSILASLRLAALEGPCQVHVRHQWPPRLDAPAEGRWVVVQPWEFGSPPAQWIPAFQDQVDEIWCYSQYVKRVYLEAGIPEAKLAVVGLGVDVDNYRPGLEPLGDLSRDDSRTTFLFVGGTIARKGFDCLLTAWAKAFGPDDPVRLVVKAMGGDTFYKGQTGEAMVRELNASGRAAPVLLFDRDLSPREVPRIYACADVLVHPYRGEGFGLPIAEAMASGLACIVTRGGSADDFCGAEEAWLVDAVRTPIPGGKVGPFQTVAAPWWLEPDIESLVLALRTAHATPEARKTKGLAARKRIETSFTWDHAAKRMEARLAALASRPSAVRSVASTKFVSALDKLSIRISSPAGSEGTVSPTGATSVASDEIAALDRLLIQAEAAAARKDFSLAEDLTLQAVEAHPRQNMAWLARAMILRGLGRFRKATEAIERSLRLVETPDALLESLQIHLAANEPGAARKMEKALKDRHGAWLKASRELFRARGQAWPLDLLKPPKAAIAAKKGKR